MTEQFEALEKKNSQVSEVTVTLKDDEKTLKSKFLLYEVYSVSVDDDTLKACVGEALSGFKGSPTDVKIRINMEF